MPTAHIGHSGIISKLAIAAFIVLCSDCYADTFVGRVVAISDGDTITVLDEDSRTHKVRLAGIDAPEKRQAFGEKSKTSLSELVFGNYVTIEYSKRDRYRRIIGKVLAAPSNSGCQETPNCQRTIDVCLEQIKIGMAWWYEKYGSEQPPQDRIDYEHAQLEAKSSRLGLWSDTNPVPPWEFRHN